jgi:hypothetical protein
MKQIFFLNGLHLIQDVWKQGLCHLPGLDMLKRAYASSIVMMISHLLHIKTKGKQLGVTKLSIFKNNFYLQHAPCPNKNYHITFRYLVYYKPFTINPQRNLRYLSRAEVEAKVLATTNTFTIKGDYELPQSSSKRNVNEWVVCLVVKGRHGYG